MAQPYYQQSRWGNSLNYWSSIVEGGEKDEVTSTVPSRCERFAELDRLIAAEDAVSKSKIGVVEDLPEKYSKLTVTSSLRDISNWISCCGPGAVMLAVPRHIKNAQRIAKAARKNITNYIYKRNGRIVYLLIAGKV